MAVAVVYCNVFFRKEALRVTKPPVIELRIKVASYFYDSRQHGGDFEHSPCIQDIQVWVEQGHATAAKGSPSVPLKSMAILTHLEETAFA